MSRYKLGDIVMLKPKDHTWEDWNLDMIRAIGQKLQIVRIDSEYLDGVPRSACMGTAHRYGLKALEHNDAWHFGYDEEWFELLHTTPQDVEMIL